MNIRLLLFHVTHQKKTFDLISIYIYLCVCWTWTLPACWGTHGYKYSYWRLIEPAFVEISMFSLHCEKPRRWVIYNVLLSWYGVNLLCPLREKMALGTFSSLAESSEILQFPNTFFRLASQCAKLKISHTWWISKIIGIIFLFLHRLLIFPPSDTVFYCHYSNNSTDTGSVPSIKKSWRHAWIQVFIQPLKSIQARKKGFVSKTT